MEKVDVKIPKLIKRTVKFFDVSVKVKPIIGIEDYAIIIKDLRDNFFYQSDMSEHIIDLRIRRDVLNLCTNINVDKISNDDLATEAISSFISKNIENYLEIGDSILQEFKMTKLQSGFGLVSSRIPSAEEVDKMVNSLKNAINGMDTEKLKDLFGATIYNKSPLFGKFLGDKIKNKEE